MLPDTDSIDQYGGHLKDFDPVEDPTTDQSALGLNHMKGSLAGLTNIAARAFRRFYAANPPTEPVSNAHGSVWGSSPSYSPTLARTGVGVFTITWPVTVENLLKQSGATSEWGGEDVSVSLRWAHGFAEGSTFYHVQCAVTSANVVTVRVFNDAGAAVDPTGTNCPLTVFAG